MIMERACTVLILIFCPTVTKACTTDADCLRHVQHSSCLRGACGCGDGLIFEEHRNACSKTVGDSCADSAVPCVSNAHCDNESMVCACVQPVFSPTQHGECYLEYGQPCGRKRPDTCNPDKFFRCRADTRNCSCQHDFQQIYDPERGVCVGRPAEPCEVHPYDGTQMGCVKNAVCTSESEHSGTCTCEPGYASAEASVCKPTLGTVCDLTEGCAPGLHLACNSSGVCDCSAGAILDKEVGQCLPKPGVLCESTSSPCVPNAFCARMSDESEQLKCQCLPEYSETESGSCKLRHAQPCNEGGCNDDELLYCHSLSRTCQCSVGRIFNGTRCVVPVGQPCDPANGIFCTDNARCSIQGKCECLPNFFSGMDGKCYPGLGQTCNSRSYCHPGLHLACDASGRCSCDSAETAHDDKSGDCVLRAGRPCNEIEETRCVRHAVCEEGQCQCVRGMERTMNGECKRGHGQQCHSFVPNECDSDSGLLCLQERCVCGRGRAFDRVRRECLGLVGQACDPRGHDCVENAECFGLNSSGLCRCGPEFEVTMEMGCGLVMISSSIASGLSALSVWLLIFYQQLCIVTNNEYV